MSTHRPHYSEKNLSTEKGLQENVFFLFILESEDLKLQLNMPRLLRFLASRWLSIFFFKVKMLSNVLNLVQVENKLIKIIEIMELVFGGHFFTSYMNLNGEIY